MRGGRKKDNWNWRKDTDIREVEKYEEEWRQLNGFRRRSGYDYSTNTSWGTETGGSGLWEGCN